MKKCLKVGILVVLCTSLVACGRANTSTETATANGQGFSIDTAPSSKSRKSVESNDMEMFAESAVSDVMGSAMESNDKVAPEGRVSEDFNTEEYNVIKENGFEYASTNPLSTFAADVDTGSYCNLRRMVSDGYSMDEIPSGAIRTEELVNYFDYDLLDENKTDGKFSLQYEVHECPWNSDNDLLVMTVEANDTRVKSAGNNFVFLIDSSGSMYSADKLDLAVEGFKKLAAELDENDVVSIVTYAGASDVLLDGCEGSDYEKICKVLDVVEADGGTNGSGGIEKAYECALKHFIKNGNNRVILASDGDMNLGITSQSGLVDLIKEKKESGIFLTTLGFGTGNYSDANMEQIADAGNGNYCYIDCIDEAERVLVDKLMQTTMTVAKDVKFQAEFNPNVVAEYRLVGYENRTMSSKDFEDDTKDGGEVGAGQQVTVVYEISYADGTNGKELKYQSNTENANDEDILTLSIRYKHPKKDTSELESYVVKKGVTDVTKDWNFVAGVAEFSLVLRDSDYKGNATMKDAMKLVKNGQTGDKYRKEFSNILATLSETEIYDTVDDDIIIDEPTDDNVLDLSDN
jgi:Ca-activated chloride channel family protein